MMKRLLIRADDLGFSEGINYGIEKSVKDGMIRSVGFMVNMPASEHGYNLIKDENVCLGLHTNISTGYPITDKELIPSIVDEKGKFKSSSVYRNTEKDVVDLDEVLLEVEAQYLRFVEITGKKPRYFEGHAIQSDNFTKAMEIIANKYDIDFLPVSFDGPTRFRNTNLYVSMDAMDSAYDPYHSLKRDALKTYPNNGICMFVCHPGYLDDYVLNNSSLTIPRTKEVEMVCSDEIKEWLINNHIEVVTYDDLD